MIMIGLKPYNWQIPKRQSRISKIVNKMLDINYLYKRIEFLESAISVILEDYQLKGVYLSQITISKAERLHKNHILRDRIIKFLTKKTKD